jgi:hypothetical protein
MIKLPKFSTQSLYDSETDFNLQMDRERLSKFLIHYEVFKKIVRIKGDIVECGIFKGTSFVRLAMFRELFKKKSKLIGFDIFGDIYPDTSFENEKKHRDHWVKSAGHSSISQKQLDNVFKKKNIKNYKLIKGDVLKTIPEYIKKNKSLKISLLNIDLAFVEPTKCAIDFLYSKVAKNGIILFDNYGGTGKDGTFYQGETKVIKDFLKKNKKKINHIDFFERPAYVIK